MIVEIKCPCCDEIHYFDIVVSGKAMIKTTENEEELTRYVFDHVRVKGFLPAEVVEANL